MLHLHPVPAFHDNYIWLLHDDSGHCLITDPGDAAPVITALDDVLGNTYRRYPRESCHGSILVAIEVRGECNTVA